MNQIKTLIFDFGDVFINLDKIGAKNNALQLFGLQEFDSDILKINDLYEIGKISTEDFLGIYKQRFPEISKEAIINAWNAIIKDFPEYRFNWLKQLSNKTRYQLILLSNTNHLHIKYVKSIVPFYQAFKACFDQFYLSHQIQLRKPNEAIFDFVLKENKLEAKNCLFIDDTKNNTDVAEKMGIRTWNIDPIGEDVVNLFDKNFGF